MAVSFRLRSLLGAVLGSMIVFAVAPLCLHWFSVPSGGVGAITIAKYPKGFDYAVVFALTIASALGALALDRGLRSPESASLFPTPRRGGTFFLTAIVFVLMFIVHDHPYEFMEMFHEGEHLTPASVMLEGGRPYRDIFFLHGFATDGGLDALILGRGSVMATRRVENVLDAAALALLVPIAAEVVATTGGLVVATLLALCAIAAGELPVFPYFRWLPLLIAVWALLRFVRKTSQPSVASAVTAARKRFALLYLAAIASSLGILWSLDVGLCACAAAAIVIPILTWLPDRNTGRKVSRIVTIALAALAAPLVVLLATGADLHHFLRDSFVIIPRSIDAIWSLPAKPLPSLALLVHPVQLWDWLASEGARYYLPPVFFGFLLALALRKRDLRILIVAIFSIILFRTAAGRCSWSHTRFALPLLGIASTAFLFEPLSLRWREQPKNVLRACLLLAAVVLSVRYFELADNATLGWKFITTWRSRLRHEGMVPYPVARGRGIYTYAENASDLAALDALAQQAGPGPIFDLSGERALYYLLNRRPATRCPDIAMLSAPELRVEALEQLRTNPPVFVVLEGTKILGSLDGIANRDRVPPIAAWIDAQYPVRLHAGRYLVAFRK